MNRENLFENLCKKAQLENIPTVDVADGVLNRLQQQEQVIYYQRPMAWIAGLSSVAALVACAATLAVYILTSDPLPEITNAISWATL